MGQSNFRSDKVSYIGYASEGHYFTHATEGGILRCRMPGTIDFTSDDLKDYAARPWDDSTTVEIKAPLMETTFPRWKNVHLLSQGPANYDVVTPEGEHFAFVPTTNGDFITPNGSIMLGSTYEFKIPNKGGRVLNFNAKGRLYASQEEWIYSNLLAAPSGGSGGSSLGLTAGGYDPEQFVQSNFVQYLYDDEDLGIMADGVSLSLQSAGFESSDGQVFSQYVNVTATLICAETAAAQLLSRRQKSRTDKTLELVTHRNEHFVFSNGALRPGRKLSFGDKPENRKQTLTFSGEVSYSKITIDSGTNTATFELS